VIIAGEACWNLYSIIRIALGQSESLGNWCIAQTYTSL
jgi:hypothetical protein